jgi:hypothetical protein
MQPTQQLNKFTELGANEVTKAPSVQECVTVFLLQRGCNNALPCPTLIMDFSMPTLPTTKFFVLLQIMPARSQTWKASYYFLAFG